MQFKKLAFLVSVLGLLLALYVFHVAKTNHPLVQVEETNNQLKLTTLYGTEVIDEPVLVELIKSPAFERLKHIRQYGVVCHARKDPEYTRYQHSLGVFHLTRKFGAPLAEQIAALLHDVSHTVFSHVGDRLFESNYFLAGKNSYQDKIHEWYLEQTGIMAILQPHGLAHACSEDAKDNQPYFEQPAPDLCADRIEYNITGGFIDGLLTRDEVAELMKSLHFEDGHWFFDNVDQAKKFALISVQLSEQRWGAAWSVFIDQSAAVAIKRACELGIVTQQDINFSTDDVVWEKLTASTDPEIMANLNRIKQCKNCYELAEPASCDIKLQGKFSGTDPLVKTDAGLARLRELDDAYRQEFERAKLVISQGWHVKFKDAPANAADGLIPQAKFA